MQNKSHIEVATLTVATAFSLIACAKSNVSGEVQAQNTANPTIRFKSGVSIETKEIPAVQIAGTVTDIVLSRHEVTEALWHEIMGGDMPEGNTALPKTGVSYSEIKEFMRKLNERSEIAEAGFAFRLPTAMELTMPIGTAEIEWRNVGNGKVDLDAPQTLLAGGWFKDNAGNNRHAVGSAKADGRGISDLLGNVWEMTSTEVPGDESLIICLGGSFRQEASRCTYNLEYWYGKNDREDDVGFRLVMCDRDECESGSKKTDDKPAQFRTRESIDVFAELEKSMLPIPGEDYAICKYEVTQALWEAVMDSNPSHFKGADLPVESFSWDECRQFIEKLNGRPEVKSSGRKYRLPTQEEWEFASRAGGDDKYPLTESGTYVSKRTVESIAWCAENSGDITHPVGQKEANAFGLYDVVGNVAELMYETAGNGVNYNSVIYSGGSWGDGKDGFLLIGMPLAFVSSWQTGDGENYIGLRLACDVAR